MESGILYVVFNKWISDPETDEMPYKIGITRNSVDDRYYGLGLKMPGKFETLFAYKIKDCSKAEQSIHSILNNNCVNGEWFKLNDEDIKFIKNICERMNGVLVTDEIENEIKNETAHKPFIIKNYDSDDDPIWSKIKSLKKEKHMSWTQLREGCNAILSGSKNYRAGAKSFANTIIRETGLSAEEIIQLLDSRNE
jgi:hypothetical protein